MISNRNLPRPFSHTHAISAILPVIRAFSIKLLYQKQLIYEKTEKQLCLKRTSNKKLIKIDYLRSIEELQDLLLFLNDDSIQSSGMGEVKNLFSCESQLDLQFTLS